MLIKACCSYGVLAHENRNYYSIYPASSVYDNLTLIIPDDLVYGINQMDEPILLLDGTKYVLSDVLTNWGDDPALRWFDGRKEKRLILKTK